MKLNHTIPQAFTENQTIVYNWFIHLLDTTNESLLTIIHHFIVLKRRRNYHNAVDTQMLEAYHDSHQIDQDFAEVMIAVTTYAYIQEVKQKQ